jgi:hypothetical protein
MARNKKAPVLGSHFDAHQMNIQGTVREYIDTLEWYRPRGFAKLRDEGAKLLRKPDDHDDWQWVSEWQDECDDLLTEWARRVARHDYITFGPFEASGDVGFYIHTDGALEDADRKVRDLSEVPRGYSGFVVHVNDHGNVSGYRFARGRAIPLFAVV